VRRWRATLRRKILQQGDEVSRLTDLIAEAKAKDPQMGADLEREFRVLSSRLPFGLNFERHRPEAVELPQRPVRKGDKVRVLPERGSTLRSDPRLWWVTRIRKQGSSKVAELELIDANERETRTAALDDLVVVSEFRDTIYPGLIATGKVERGGDKPYHTVINGENYHVLKALTFTHRGRVDAIYIDPPYNTGAKDWKYNNDYVEGDDLYRHSKWLAMMERRLLIARELLNPADSVLICTIDEKEYLRLGLLLEQIFLDARIQMISSVIAQKGVSRTQQFYRTDEYLFFVTIGAASVQELALPAEWQLGKTSSAAARGIVWSQLRRSGTNSTRADRPTLFYPIFVDPSGPKIVSAGDSPPEGKAYRDVRPPKGTVAVWPLRGDGTEGNWQQSQTALMNLVRKGYVRVGRQNENGFPISYLKRGSIRKIEGGTVHITGRAPSDGHVLVDASEYEHKFVPGTHWNIASHDATYHGSQLVSQFLPSRHFPFPKSLYAVEDALRFFVAKKRNAVVLDYFAGSGTTAHAVMRLNRQDSGSRQCISVTNNEVAADEQKTLREQRLRPGDADWEQWGICDYITKPRIEAAITGKTPEAEPIKGDYKFTDEFPMAEGFDENAEFFTLTYESPIAISYNKAFARIAPLLWLRAGSQGRCIDKLPAQGWDVAETYGLLVDLDGASAFIKAAKKAKGLRIAYIVTDDERRFQMLARRLPEGVEPVRLYESYLTNFSFANGD
jgi:adenine-specific DNA-methyltransferase